MQIIPSFKDFIVKHLKDVGVYQQTICELGQGFILG